MPRAKTIDSEEDLEIFNDLRMKVMVEARKQIYCHKKKVFFYIYNYQGTPATHCPGCGKSSKNVKVKKPRRRPEYY